MAKKEELLDELNKLELKYELAELIAEIKKEILDCFSNVWSISKDKFTLSTNVESELYTLALLEFTYYCDNLNDNDEEADVIFQNFATSYKDKLSEALDTNLKKNNKNKDTVYRKYEIYKSDIEKKDGIEFLLVSLHGSLNNDFSMYYQNISATPTIFSDIGENFRNRMNEILIKNKPDFTESNEPKKSMAKTIFLVIIIILGIILGLVILFIVGNNLEVNRANFFKVLKEVLAYFTVLMAILLFAELVKWIYKNAGS